MSDLEVGYEIPHQDRRPRLLSSMVRMNRYLLLLLLIPAGVIYFWPKWDEQEAAKKKLGELTVQRDSLAAQAAKLKTKRELLRNNPEYLETVARDELGMKKEGELTLNFEE